MPAEWEPHAATWLAWPHNPEDWPDRFASIPYVYADIVRCLAAGERVEICVQDAGEEEQARAILRHTGVRDDNVRFHHWPTNRVWTRDSGPIFVRNGSGEIALTDWRFNAWAKYDDWQLDDTLPDKVSALLHINRWQPQIGNHRVVLEGGSIDVNGAGVLLTTEECLLSEFQQRNPGISREQMERCFAEYLGIEKVIWLRNGIVGDDTHGHVDDLARFVSEDTIVIASEDDRDDENYAILAEDKALLEQARDQHGKPFRIVTLPMPEPVIIAGQRVPASYANFYIANGAVLVPTFSDAADRVALNTLAELFPARKVIGIPCREFIWGLGALHCMTQQQPA